jgi:hypothetical protein
MRVFVSSLGAWASFGAPMQDHGTFTSSVDYRKTT